jgi:RNA polymerase sigma-70 factor (ECF subfamily)
MNGMPMGNAEWLEALESPGSAKNEALARLRTLLVNGLKRGLSGWRGTIGPEFDDLAEDFAQDALIKILDNLDTFRGESQFTTWAHKIAVRVALTELRRKRWKDVSLDGLLEAGGEGAGSRLEAGSEAGPEKAAEQTDLLQHVKRIIMNELSKKQKTAMVAVGMKGMPLEEVAKRMGMTRNALYKLLHDARVRLKRRLAKEGLTPSEVLATFERG